MSNIITIKTKGDIIKGELSEKISPESYLKEEDGCFIGIIDFIFPYVDNKKNYIKNSYKIKEFEEYVKDDYLVKQSYEQYLKDQYKKYCNTNYYGKNKLNQNEFEKKYLSLNKILSFDQFLNSKENKKYYNSFYIDSNYSNYLKNKGFESYTQYIEKNKFLKRHLISIFEHNKFDVLSNSLEQIKESKNKEDIANVLKKLIIDEYDNFGKIREMLNDDIDYILPIALKQLMLETYKTKIELLSNSELIDLEKMKLSGIDDDKILKMIDTNISNDTKLNQYIIKVIKFSLDTVYIENPLHLCAQCTNLSPNNCPKVADIIKEDISNYKFIKSGYTLEDPTILEKRNNPYVFMVSECDNFNLIKLKKRNETFQKKL